MLTGKTVPVEIYRSIAVRAREHALRAAEVRVHSIEKPHSLASVYTRARCTTHVLNNSVCGEEAFQTFCQTLNGEYDDGGDVIPNRSILRSPLTSIGIGCADTEGGAVIGVKTTHSSACLTVLLAVMSSPKPPSGDAAYRSIAISPDLVDWL